MTRNTKILIAISFIVTSLGVTLVYHKTKKKLIVSCQYYLLKTNKLTNETIKLSIAYFFYSDNTGLKTEFGSSIENDKTYIIDKDFVLRYSDMDHDGVYKVAVLKDIRSNRDNSPRESISSNVKYKSINYINFSKIGDDVYYIQERSLPYFICAKTTATSN